MPLYQYWNKTRSVGGYDVIFCVPDINGFFGFHSSLFKSRVKYSRIRFLDAHFGGNNQLKSNHLICPFVCRLAEFSSIKLRGTRKTRFKKICQLRKYSTIPRQAIDDYKEKMAFRCKFVVEDRIEVVGDLILHPFIYTFNENPPPDFLRKLGNCCGAGR